MRRVRVAANSSAARSSSTPLVCALSPSPRVRVGEALPLFNAEALCKAYRAASRRLILLGLDGTLIGRGSGEQVLAHLKNFHDFHGDSLPPSDSTLECLAALASDPCNLVYVLSARSAHQMHSTLGRVTNIGLVAEMGFMLLPPSPPSPKGGSAIMESLDAPPALHPALRPPTSRVEGVTVGVGLSRGGGGVGVGVGASAGSGGVGVGVVGGGGMAQRRSLKISHESEKSSVESGYDDDDDDDGLPSATGGEAAAADGAAGRAESDAGASASPGRRVWLPLLSALPQVSPTWRERAKDVMTEYTARTNGAYTRELCSSVQWCYEHADPDFGLMQARTLASELLRRLDDGTVDVRLDSVKGLVEVHLGGVNKGAAADTLLVGAEAAMPLDFVLSLSDGGDDDEFMISATNARAAAPRLRERLHGRLFSIVAGARASSHAHAVAADGAHVLSLLEALRDASSTTSAAAADPHTAAGGLHTHFAPSPSPPQTATSAAAKARQHAVASFARSSDTLVRVPRAE
jgi:trehalose-6-phosphatase